MSGSTERVKYDLAAFSMFVFNTNLDQPMHCQSFLHHSRRSVPLGAMDTILNIVDYNSINIRAVLTLPQQIGIHIQYPFFALSEGIIGPDPHTLGMIGCCKVKF